MNKLESYMEQVVKSFSDASFSGFKQNDNYWVQMRYYKADGSVDAEAYTYLALYTIPKATMDSLVRKAMDDAATTVKPKTEDEQARQYGNGFGELSGFLLDGFDQAMQAGESLPGLADQAFSIDIRQIPQSARQVNKVLGFTQRSA